MNHPILVADLGATFSDIAFIDPHDLTDIELQQYHSTDFPNPMTLLDRAITDFNHPISTLKIAIAAPIPQNSASLITYTNNEWQFTIDALKAHFPQPITVMNDFVALAHSLPYLQDQDLYSLNPFINHPVTDNQNSERRYALIGTGSGFGTATLIIHADQSTTVIPAEGGFSLYSPQDKWEAELIALAYQSTSTPLIIEDLLSGNRGIAHLATLMAQKMEITESINPIQSPKTLLKMALEEKDPFAIDLLNRYCAMLGNIAANIVTTTGAMDGLYIGGGFAPRFPHFIAQSPFYTSFINRPYLAKELEKIPLSIIMEPYATLVGLKQYNHHN